MTFTELNFYYFTIHEKTEKKFLIVNIFSNKVESQMYTNCLSSRQILGKMRQIFIRRIINLKKSK